MEAEKSDVFRLMGVDIPVQKTDYDDMGTSEAGEYMVLLPEERLLDVKESERKSSEVSSYDDGDHEDTTLRLSCGSVYVSRTGKNSEKDQLALRFSGSDNVAGTSDVNIMLEPVLSPMPLKFLAPNSSVLLSPRLGSLNSESFRESSEKGTPDSATDHDAGEGTWRSSKKPFQESNEEGIRNSPSNTIKSDENGGKRSVKRKGKEVVDDDIKGSEGSESVNKRKRSTITSHSSAEPLPTIEQVPWLLQKIELENGSPPVFLYRKKLQVSDLRKNQNRIFLTKCEKLMEFLTEEERHSVYNTKEGLEFSAVDPQERSYKLHLGKWGSLKMLVLKSQWYKLVHENNAESGFWTEMWGYRVNGKLRLAVNFRKPREEPVEALSGEGQSAAVNFRKPSEEPVEAQSDEGQNGINNEES